MGQANERLKFHTNAMPKGALDALRTLARFTHEQDFVLAGGTAVALQLGHRISVDLDLFTRNKIDAAQLGAEVKERIPGFKVSSIMRGALHGELSGVKVSLLQFQYPWLEEPIDAGSLHCRIATLTDLAAMKMNAVTQRGSRKDFVDVYALGTKVLPLSAMLDAYRRKFALEDISPVLYGLSYTEDADTQEMPRMLWDVRWPMIKREITKWVRKLPR